MDKDKIGTEMVNNALKYYSRWNIKSIEDRYNDLSREIWELECKKVALSKLLEGS
jgi:hypothetical protein